ncbi:MAG: hypothetical protein JF604_27540, partial [Bradyrhizobium sp.]|nr:hypothetical protein [Bradyrhizobium sp.]
LDHLPEAIAQAAATKLNVKPSELLSCTVFKRGNDARKKHAVLLVYTLDVEVANEAAVLKRFVNDVNVKPTPNMDYQFVASAPAELTERPVVIGAGPCGIFAALVLAQMGFKPIILDRGKIVRERTKDTWDLWRHSKLHTESNVQFGEGGAGTFSDGKLYSQIKDPRHLGRKVLTEFVRAEAPEEILTEAHPHIGTFRLVKMVENMRTTIESLGGEYRWQSRVTDLDIQEVNGKRQVRGVVLENGEHIAANSEENRVVTNGMSQYSRNERNANAGMVVGITPEIDYPGHPLAGIEYQRKWESAAFIAGGKTYAAPAQRVGDFIAGKASTSLGSVIPSYKPGVVPTDLAQCLPDFAVTAMREALGAFGKKIKGYDMADAVLTGVETRTSSPIRIKRDD